MRFSLAIWIISVLTITSLFAQNEGWEIKAVSQNNYHAQAVANGMIGILPSEKPLQIKEVILNGVWDIYGRGGVSNIVHGINFLNMDLGVSTPKKNDVKWVSENQHIKDWSQTLNMYDATFTTAFNFDDIVEVKHQLIALRHLAYTGAIYIELKAKKNASIVVKNQLIVPDVNLPGKSMYHKFGEHGDLILSSISAKSPTGKYELAATTSFVFDSEKKPDVKMKEVSEKEVEASFTIELKKGETYSFTLVGSQCNTAQSVDAINEAERKAIYAHLEGYDRLKSRHDKAWEKLWESDIVIEGDNKAQLDVRQQLFNLYSFERKGTRLSVSPVGLSGNGYNGHVFWDTELWMFPTYLLMQPELAKNILDYRVDRLEQAKKNALAHGYEGAMFPWESALTGEEDTPTWALTGPFEQHITACIGLAFWKYYQVTQDKEWLETTGYEVLQNVADFWVSRVEKDENGVCHINNVVCADEYAENVNDNAFTNAAAIQVLRATVKAANILEKQPNKEWMEVANAIPVLVEEGITMEYDGYDGRMIKQADVNLLSFPLQYYSDKAQIKRNLEYYEPKITYSAPAMSHSILSVIASRLGDVENAYRLFQRGYIKNQKPPFNVITEQPDNDLAFFVTGSGGMMQAVLFGFGGLEITDNGVTQIPSSLPKQWKSMTIKGVGKDKQTFTIVNNEQ
ncbi:glycoside hydrolase family 65 protein [Flammeovirga agarivorans]|uniref:Glycoside hydrolase family 65 protein n=1 Tax=Flammeovirga agarivorans TaxID=2726742 RepID=A0A7X8SIN6_9BACT|nr:glycoside hydrolase family 65 protein [Flammeovirga agarivorans]NLR90803.1 glycoside hydrolase family 65 protein [Flammeovirga agarivorans]